MIREMVDKHENQIFHLHSEMQTIQQNFQQVLHHIGRAEATTRHSRRANHQRHFHMEDS